MVYDAAGYHQTRVQRASCNTAKRVPCSYEAVEVSTWYLQRIVIQQHAEA